MRSKKKLAYIALGIVLYFYPRCSKKRQAERLHYTTADRELTYKHRKSRIGLQQKTLAQSLAQSKLKGTANCKP